MVIEATVIEKLIKDALPDADVTVDGADVVHMSAVVCSS